MKDARNYPVMEQLRIPKKIKHDKTSYKTLLIVKELICNSNKSPKIIN